MKDTRQSFFYKRVMILAEHSTWIKLNRNITRWAWYKNGNTVRVFLHLLLRANVRASKFMGITIQRGEAVGGLRSIADDLDISMQQVRTAIGHLQKTGEISVKNYSKFSVFHIEKYEQYQNQNATESVPASKTKRTSHKQTIRPWIRNASDRFDRERLLTDVVQGKSVQIRLRSSGRRVDVFHQPGEGCLQVPESIL